MNLVKSLLHLNKYSCIRLYLQSVTQEKQFDDYSVMINVVGCTLDIMVANKLGSSKSFVNRIPYDIYIISTFNGVFIK